MDLSVANAIDRTEKVSMRSTEYRKVIKPLLERRRRARINSCLDELKALILETTETDNADSSKLEKADILELTVQHLRNFRHRQQQRPGSEDKFRAGFAECAHQVSSFLTGEDHLTKQRLMSHLTSCIDRFSHAVVRQQAQSPSEILTPTPPPSPVSPITRSPSSEHSIDYQHFDCSTNTQLHRADYVKCSSPDAFNHYRMPLDNRPIKEEFAEVYYSSVPTVYMRKMKSENGSGRPWRPW